MTTTDNNSYYITGIVSTHFASIAQRSESRKGWLALAAHQYKMVSIGAAVGKSEGQAWEKGGGNVFLKAAENSEYKWCVVRSADGLASLSFLCFAFCWICRFFPRPSPSTSPVSSRARAQNAREGAHPGHRLSRDHERGNRRRADPAGVRGTKRASHRRLGRRAKGDPSVHWAA